VDRAEGKPSRDPEHSAHPGPLFVDPTPGAHLEGLDAGHGEMHTPASRAFPQHQCISGAAQYRSNQARAADHRCHPNAGANTRITLRIDACGNDCDRAPKKQNSAHAIPG
jgi:hypothetical protein